MLFKNQDQARTFIELIKTEQKSLASLQKKYDSIGPKWMEVETEIEHLISLDLARERSFRQPALSGQAHPRFIPGTGTDQHFWDQRGEKLTREIEAAAAKRDELTNSIVPEMIALKNTIAQRLNIVVGAFSSWASTVADIQTYTQIRGRETQYEIGDLKPELEGARHKVDEIMDPAALLDFIVGWVERLEQMENVRCPLLRLDSAVARALAISPAA